MKVRINQLWILNKFLDLRLYYKFWSFFAQISLSIFFRSLDFFIPLALTFSCSKLLITSRVLIRSTFVEVSDKNLCSHWWNFYISAIYVYSINYSWICLEDVSSDCASKVIRMENLTGVTIFFYWDHCRSDLHFINSKQLE